MRRIHIYVWIVLSFMFHATGYASVNKSSEIQYLLSYIETSHCTFVRNGSSHDAINARAHIEKKYNYLRSRISSTEEFIRHAATKSSISGKYYKVICSGKDYLVGQWLNKELIKYRGNALSEN